MSVHGVNIMTEQVLKTRSTVLKSNQLWIG